MVRFKCSGVSMRELKGLTSTVPIVPVTFSATALGIVALALLIRRRELLKLREQSERKGVRSKDSVKNRWLRFLPRRKLSHRNRMFPHTRDAATSVHR